MKNDGAHHDLSLKNSYYALIRSGYLPLNLNKSNRATFQATENKSIAMETVRQSQEQMLLLKLFSDNQRIK